MSHNPKITLMGFYEYDDSLFDNLNLPTDINKTDFINSFLLKHGENPCIYTNFDFVKFAIGVWSNKWYDSILKIITAMNEEYNPLHNFDRYEEYTDTENRENDYTGTSANNGDVENTVSAFNVNTYQPDNKSTSTSSARDTSNNTEDRELTHDGHLYGNIGVTTSQQMLSAELELRKNQNIIDIVSDMLFKEFCIYTY